MTGLDSGAAAGTTFINNSLQTISPSSDAFSHGPLDSQSQTQQTQTQKEARTNGTAKGPKRPSNAFELYCNDTRPGLKEKAKEDSSLNVEEELARGWKDLPDEQREEFQTRYDEELAKYKQAKEESLQPPGPSEPAERSQSRTADTPAQEEDVEMGNSDTEEADGADKAE